MSICLQSMIDELLLKTVGGMKNQEVTGKPWTYITRDGHLKTIVGPLPQDIFNKNIKVIIFTTKFLSSTLLFDNFAKIFVGK